MKKILFLLLSCCLVSLKSVAQCSAPIDSVSGVVCEGFSVQMTDNDPSTGTWTCSPTTVATIDASTGMLSAVSAGSVTVTYSTASGCVYYYTLTVNASPALTSGTSVVVGGSIPLSVTPPSGTWAISSGGIATIVGGVLTGISPGTAFATYYTTAGCKAGYLVTVYGCSDPISGPTSVCAGSTINLSDADPSGGTWSASGAGTINATTGVLTGVSGGTASVTFTATSGCVYYYSVTVDAPAITASGTATICSGSSTTLSASGGASYSWSPGGSLSSATDAHPIASPTVTTTYTVTGTDAAGCTGTATVTVTVDHISVSAGSNVTLCNGASAVLTASGGTSYSWMPGASATNPLTVTPSSTTTYTVTGTDAAGCTGTASVTVTVNPVPDVTTANISVCTSPGTLTATSTYTGTLNYVWTPSTGLSCPACASTTVATVSGSTSRSYTVTVTDPSTGCNNSAVAVVTFNPSSILAWVDETAPFSIHGDAAFTNCGSGVQLKAFPDAGTYSWAGTSGTISAPASQSSTFTPTVTGVYTVTVTLYGCVGKATPTVVVPTGCSPCDAFKVNCSGAPDDGILKPFHTNISTSFSAFPSSGSINNYYFVNNITIPGNLDITDKVFFMGSNKSITVGQGAHVHISHSHLFTCSSSTWAGISVSNSSSAYGVLSIDNNSLIEYATTALSCAAGSSSSRTAVWVNPATDSAIVSSNASIYNNNTSGMNFSYWPGTLPTTFTADTTFPFIVSGNIFTGRLFDCFTDGVTSYPFVWPTVGYLQTPLSTPEYYNPRFNLDTYDSTTVIMTGSTANTGYAKNGMFLNGNKTVSSGSSNTYYGFRVGIKDASGNRAPNMFDHMCNNGIVSGGASIELQNNLFRYICTYATGAVTCTLGVANGQHQRILMNNGAGSGFGNRIYNCVNRGGIATVNLSNFYNYDISHVMMSLGVGSLLPSDGVMKSAISCGSDAYEIADFHDNVFYNYHFGLGFVVNASATNVGSFVADHNVFSASYWDGTGTPPDAFSLFPTTPRPILVTAITFNGNKSRTAAYTVPFGTVNINNNQINQVQTGVYMNQTGNMPVYIANNAINIHSYSGSIIGSTSYGVRINDGASHSITGNDIGGEGYTVSNLNGAFVSLSGSSTTLSDISCNNVHDVTTGFNFQGTTSQSYLNWQNNVMQKCKTGMNLNTAIGQQGSTTAPIDNYWKDDGTYLSSSLYWWTSTSGVKQITASTSYTAGSALYVRNISPSNMPSSGAYTGYVSGTTLNSFSWSPSTYPYNSCTGQASAACYGCRSISGSNGTADNAAVDAYNIYPNPTTGNIFIEHSGDGETKARVLNAVGMSVYTGSLDFAAGSAQMQLGAVAPGMYLLELTDAKGEKHVSRILVQHP